MRVLASLVQISVREGDLVCAALERERSFARADIHYEWHWPGFLFHRCLAPRVCVVKLLQCGRDWLGRLRVVVECCRCRMSDECWQAVDFPERKCSGHLTQGSCAVQECPQQHVDPEFVICLKYSFSNSGNKITVN